MRVILPLLATSSLVPSAKTVDVSVTLTPVASSVTVRAATSGEERPIVPEQRNL
jgi:hypothetical protein